MRSDSLVVRPWRCLPPWNDSAAATLDFPCKCRLLACALFICEGGPTPDHQSNRRYMAGTLLRLRFIQLEAVLSRDDPTNGGSAHLCWSITRRSRRLQCAPAVPGEGTAHERSASAVWCRVDQSQEKHLPGSPGRWGAGLPIHLWIGWISWRQVDGTPKTYLYRLHRNVSKKGSLILLRSSTSLTRLFGLLDSRANGT